MTSIITIASIGSYTEMIFRIKGIYIIHGLMVSCKIAYTHTIVVFWYTDKTFSSLIVERSFSFWVYVLHSTTWRSGNSTKATESTMIIIISSQQYIWNGNSKWYHVIRNVFELLNISYERVSSMPRKLNELLLFTSILRTGVMLCCAVMCSI